MTRPWPLGSIVFSLRSMRKHPLLAIALVTTLLAALYWLFIASDRYVSEARVVIQRTDLPALTS